MMGLPPSPPLLIAWHSRTGAARALAQAAARAAGARGRLLPCEAVQPADLIAARGYLFVCPENLATMSGLMKEMFDRCYYPVLGRIEGRAYATIIAAGLDGSGAERQIDRICTGWRLRRAAPSLIAPMDAQSPESILAPKSPGSELIDQAMMLGEAMAEGLEQGIF